jgi:hypothetical protein
MNIEDGAPKKNIAHWLYMTNDEAEDELSSPLVNFADLFIDDSDDCVTGEETKAEEMGQDIKAVAVTDPAKMSDSCVDASNVEKLVGKKESKRHITTSPQYLSTRKRSKIYESCTPRHIDFEALRDYDYVQEGTYIHGGTMTDMEKTLTFHENGTVIFQERFLLE